jgi:hypothetical protein
MIEYEDKFIRTSQYMFFNPKRDLFYIRMYNTDDEEFQYWCFDKDNLPKITCEVNNDTFDLKLSRNPDNFSLAITFQNYEHNISYDSGWSDWIDYPRLSDNYGNQRKLFNGSTTMHYSGYFDNKWVFYNDNVENTTFYYLETEPLSSLSGYQYNSTSGCFVNTEQISGDTFKFEENIQNPGGYRGGNYCSTPLLIPLNGVQLT